MKSYCIPLTLLFICAAVTGIKAQTNTITLQSDASTLAAATALNDPRLSSGNTQGLTFQPVAVGAFGTFTPVPLGAPPAAAVVNIPPGDGESGFFKVTFTLPSTFSGIQLNGSANVDDGGVAFLNGNLISSQFTEFGDVAFSTANPQFFQPGTNELVISDNNSGLGPSGAAFFAVITYSVGMKTVFLIHGIGQDSGDMAALAANLQDPVNGVDQTRFKIDAGYDFADCAKHKHCDSSCTIGDEPVGTPNRSNMTNGARKLAQYINDQAPSGDIVLVGYSMGGLIARDMIVNNYHHVLSSTRHVAALVTLGTPNLGYPFLSIDTSVKCGPLVKEMAGDFRTPAEHGRVDFFENSIRIAAVSPYLKNLNDNWPSAKFLPGTWLAVAGAFCTGAERRGSRKPKIGCSDATPLNDGVVCEQSATYTDANLVQLHAGPGPLIFDPFSAHTDGFFGKRVILPCGDFNDIIDVEPLFNPPPTGHVLKPLTDFINAVP